MYRLSALLLALVLVASPRAYADEHLVAPIPVETPHADYPAAAREQHKEGTSLVLVTIDVAGAVTAAELTESAGDASLDEAALAAARNWRFKPATRDGKVIESQVKIPFHFHAHPAEGPHTDLPPAGPAPSPSPSTSPSTSTTTAVVPAGPVGVDGPAGVAVPSEKELAVAADANVPTYESSVAGKRAPSRGASDYHVDVEKLSLVPHGTATDFLKLAPGILITNEGGDGHAEQIFLRGFNAREGQDIEFSVDGVPINEPGNLHGNGYADLHFIIPELVQSLRVIEGPFDPRQGNFAVAGSADYHLGLADKGITAKFTIGSFGTYRLFLGWAPVGGQDGTFAAATISQTDGYGSNRDGRQASVIAQYEGHIGTNTTYRVTGQAFLSSYHTAGVLRDDDYRAGRVEFYGTNDARQGEDSSRYSVAAHFQTRAGRVTFTNQLFGIARPLRIRANFTGYLLDVQEPLQNPHAQRGDLIDLSNMAFTIGARGSGRIAFKVKGLPQDIELGYFARGDFVSSTQQRDAAANGHPYLTETNLDAKLGDIGLFADVNLRFARWLSLRGGLRGDLFTYDVHNNCAVQSIRMPSPTRPLNDASCYDQEGQGQHREPDQRITTVGATFLPRGSLLIGPFYGLGLTASAGKGVRSIDPVYVTQDGQAPFASIAAYEGGLTFDRRFRNYLDVHARSVAFYTGVEQDLIFSQTAGRNTLAGATSRIGSATNVRVTGPFFDVAANVTYVRATFDDTGLLIPYVPDLVFRSDAALFGELPGKKTQLWGKRFRAALAAGVTYVAPRPLPYGQRSDSIATLDTNLTFGWWMFDLGLSVQNIVGTQYRLGEYNYASDFQTASSPTLVPMRHFAAGAPRTVLFSFAVNYGAKR